MLRLILMRHAKSSWKEPSLDDHARPLNKRGRRSSPLVARRLAELDWCPDLVVSSDSTRTRETWNGMEEQLSEAEVRWEPSYYLGGLGEIVDSAAGWGSATTVLVLGHNPGWEDAVSDLTGGTESMTTGNAALLRSEAPDWLRAFQSRFELIALIRPRELE